MLVVATGPLAIVGGALLGVSGAAAIAHGVQVWRWGKLGNDATSAQQASRLVAALVQVQAHAARRFRDVDVHVQVDAQTVTMQLSGGTEATRRRLRLALDQLLGGCPTPHYALELVGAREGPGDAPWRRLVAREAVEEVVLGHVPVPTALGTSRKLALAWREAFHQHVASARLVAVRRDAATGQVPFVGGEALAWAEFGGGAVSHRALLE